MKRTTNQMIEKAINEGYELLENGIGSYEEALQKYRAEGYDVRSWYLVNKKEEKTWVMYGKKKSPRKRTAKKIQFNFDILTSKELREICKQKKVTKYYKMTKQQMINSLKEVC